MRFGPLALGEAEGAILAHTVRLQKGSVKKGTRLDAGTIERLEAAGIETVVAARLGNDDVHEDEAADRLARELIAPGLRAEPAFTGRANLFAEADGVFCADPGGVDRLNAIDEGITLATLADRSRVVAGTMVATVKIIPFAVPKPALDEAVETAAGRPMSLRSFTPRRVGLVATVLPGTADKMLDKTHRILTERLERAHASLLREIRVEHDPTAISGALRELEGEGADLLIVFGASAIVDRGDVVPAGIEAAGGTVRHFGMPVDPGNLLLLADLGGRPVLGAPGCARSPKENGFDWVLDRLLAGIEVGPDDIRGMGVGGLLQEIVSRPQPREGSARAGGGVAAVVLAGGQSRRMGPVNKLLQEVEGAPMVRRVVETALASACSEVVVVTGHERDAVEAALSGLDVRFVHNEAFAEGLSTSLRTGIGALGPEPSGALVLLGDMPTVDTSLLDRMLQAFAPEEGRQVIVPVHRGKRGNPVLWARRFFAQLLDLKGDVGARHLIGEAGAAVFEVEAGRDSVLTDVDTPEALERLLKGIRGNRDS